MKNILALDLGTTGNRAIVFDKKQRIVSKQYEEFPQIFPKPGWVEHDAEAIWRSVQKILKKTFASVSEARIAAIGITNQRETVVLWDRKTGKPIHNAIVWQDRRTAPLCESLRKRGKESLIHKRTGLVLDPYFSATKIAWLLDNVKGAKEKARRGQLLAGTIDTWIIWKLSGGRSHVTDSSNASRTLLFNLYTLAWDKKLCDLFGVPMNILPTVIPSSAGAHPGVRPGGHAGPPQHGNIPILGIVGDQQGAAFAQGCFAPDVLKNTYGTGLFAVENTGRSPRFSKNLLTTVAWSLGDLKNTEYAVEGSVFIAGAALQWLRDGLQILKKAPDAARIARTIPGNEGVYFVPALSGLGAPYWDAHARGLFIGITRGTTRAHFIRAALEANAYQTRDILDVMKKDTRHPVRILRVDGGASVDDFMMQFQADILGIPVERPVILETTALGAAGLAGIAAGIWKDRQTFLKLRQIDKVFRPKMRRAEADALYSRWQDAAARSRNWNR